MLNLKFLKKIPPEARLVLSVARWIITNEGLTEIKDFITRENIDWGIFNEFIVYHELYAFSYICFKKYPYLLPVQEAKLLEKSYYRCLSDTSLFWEEFKRLAVIFKDKSIMFAPLKGISFILNNMYADKAFLRPMCDIDILLRKEDLPIAEEILAAEGYKKDLHGLNEDYWKNKGYHLGFIRKTEKGPSYCVEAHWALDYKRTKPILPLLWSRVKKVIADGAEIYSISPEDTLISLALHQRRFGKMLCLKNICDIAILLNNRDGGFDWDYLLREAQAGNIRVTLYSAIIQVFILFDIRVPDFVLKKLNMPKYRRWLIEQFILCNISGNSLRQNNGKVNINNLYLKNHFLLYDNIWEPLAGVINVPKEQFAKFYGLKAYDKRTDLLYSTRLFYMPFKAAASLITNEKGH